MIIKIKIYHEINTHSAKILPLQMTQKARRLQGKRSDSKSDIESVSKQYISVAQAAQGMIKVCSSNKTNQTTCLNPAAIATQMNHQIQCNNIQDLRNLNH